MKFSLRDLFLATLIVALALGWWIDHRRQAAEADSLRAAEMAASKAFWSLSDLMKRAGFIVDVDPARDKSLYEPTDKPLPNAWERALPDPRKSEKEQVLDAIRRKLADDSRDKYGVP